MEKNKILRKQLGLSDFDFEHLSTLWNIACLLIHLGGAQAHGQDKSKTIEFYQQAAGIFGYIREEMPKVLNRHDVKATCDISTINLNALRMFALACAQAGFKLFD